jgi:hypothetical protein
MGGDSNRLPARGITRRFDSPNEAAKLSLRSHGREHALVSVAAAFAAYLTDPARYEGLALALASAGLEGQAALLRAFQAGVGSADASPLGAAWAGRQCGLGLTPPAEAAGGDLWFDPVEVTVMILVPRPARQYAAWPADVQQRMTPFVGWLAIAPARAWQVRGWADAAGGAGFPAGPADTAPATGLSGQAAEAYAAYFGKSFADEFAWHGVAAMSRLGVRLWPDRTPELTGYRNEGEVRVLTRDQALSAEDDDTEDADREEDGIFHDFTPLPGVAFRTQVPSQLGLLGDRSRWGRNC